MRPIDELYTELKSIQSKIESIRNTCEHNEKRDGWYSWRPGAMDWTSLCSICDQSLGAALTEPPSQDTGVNFYFTNS